MNRALNYRQSATVEAVHLRFGRLLSRKDTPLVKTWAVVALAGLVMTMLSAAVQMKLGTPMLHELFDPEVMQRYAARQQGNSFSALSLLMYPLSLLVSTLYYSSLNVVREVDMSSSSMSFADARAIITERFLPVGLAVIAMMLAASLGMMCCLVPGLVAMFLLYLAPYLVATGESVGESLSLSSQLARKHWLVLVLVGVVGLVAGIGFLFVQSAALAFFGSSLATTGIVIGHIATWAFSSVVGYFLWLYTGSALATIADVEAI